MKKFVFLTTLAIFISSTVVGWQTLSSAAATHENLPPISKSIPPINAFGPSCANPAPDEVDQCNELEQQILASTVRLEWHFKIKNDNGGYTLTDGTTGFATIKAGRYLVTHNHPGISLSNPDNEGLTTVSIYTTDSQSIWVDGPLEAISITVEDPETLVLDFGSYGGQGLFGSIGMPSAEFKAWESLPLQPGMEVAQVDGDGERLLVNWVTIENIITENGTPRVELANIVAPGASGGGVFWNGCHVANTKSQVTAYDEDTGVVLRQFSVAALNSPQVAGQLE